MYFKHPELLYALLLLVIPIIVHLFQLRRFKTTEFTNVKFLKKAVLQTRKSSRLKKFLILCTRLLLLACIILAFSQPYFPPASGEVQNIETVIYLDNSYSMQAKGKNGILLKRSIQDILENVPEDEEFTLFTNEDEFRNISSASAKERLQTIGYSVRQLPWDVVQLKAKNFFKNSSGSKNFIAVSDFQHIQDSISPVAEDISTHLVKLKPENNLNITLDTAYVSSKNVDEITLQIGISALEEQNQEVSIALYDDDRLLSRKTIGLNDKLNGRTSFSFPSKPLPYGRIEIEDNGMSFDNRLFFSINESPPVKVVAVGDQEAEFLERIYSEPEFSLQIFSENNVDFNQLSQANLIVLNEIERIQASMVTTLEQLLREDVFLIVIPSPNAELSEYNLLFKNLALPVLNEKSEEEKLITDIVFEHPLYLSVFDERVTNFEYPKVQTSYSVAGAPTAILKYQNGRPFLFEQKNVFVFTAPLNRSNSNFKSAPLIVPTFYNIGNLAITPPQLYFTLGVPQEISIQANLQKDEILKLYGTETAYIPQQQNFKNKVELVLEDLPKKEGHYRVLHDSVNLGALSFNVNRSESEEVKGAIEAQEELAVFAAVPDVFSKIKSDNEVDSLWKWFVIFAFIFLLTEMLILKFLK